MWCLCFDVGLVRVINFCLSLHPAAKEYETAVRLSLGNSSEYGRCWMWLSGSWVGYVTMALHWLLHTKSKIPLFSYRAILPFGLSRLIVWLVPFDRLARAKKTGARSKTCFSTCQTVFWHVPLFFYHAQNNFPVRRNYFLSAVKKIRLLVIDLNQQARCHFAQLWIENWELCISFPP